MTNDPFGNSIGNKEGVEWDEMSIGPEHTNPCLYYEKLVYFVC